MLRVISIMRSPTLSSIPTAPQARAAPMTSASSALTSRSPEGEANMRSVVWPSTEHGPLNGMFHMAFIHRALA